MSVWHLEVTPPAGATNNPPAADYLPLARLVRPGDNIFQEQLAFLEQYATLRPDREAEILAQLGMPTAFLSSIAFLRADRSRWTLELLGAAYRLAGFVEMRIKHALAVRRPIEFSPQVQPIIITPAHGSMPSGHACEAFLLAVVLKNILHAGGNPAYKHVSYGVQLMRQAARIAINRTVAGVHFPVDSVAGAVLGATLGQYLVNRMSGAANFTASEFDGAKYPGDEDFLWSNLINIPADQPQANVKYDKLYLKPFVPPNNGLQPIDPANKSAILSDLWTKAVAEWA